VIEDGAGDPMTYATRVRDAIWSVDSSRPVMEIEAMATLVNSCVAIPKATRALVLGMALLAWLLSAVGVFGVVAYAVRMRRSELGIRLALGASPNRLERDQLKDISPVVVLGIGAGVMLGLLAARAAGSVLYGVSPSDPLSLPGGCWRDGRSRLRRDLPARTAGRPHRSERGDATGVVRLGGGQARACSSSRLGWSSASVSHAIHCHLNLPARFASRPRVF
jgi:ABC-type antimicrobial peptide transport system permease subunit